MTRHIAKVELKKRGWTQEQAARKCGVGYEHLNRGLNGHRESRRLIAAVMALPKREEAASQQEAGK